MASLSEKLASLFVRAEEAARAADSDDDGGTCNFDTPAFRIDGCRDSVIREASRISGVPVDDFKWLGGKRWYWLRVTMNGQANRRTRSMDAAMRVLKSATDIPNFRACGYYQMG